MGSKILRQMAVAWFEFADHLYQMMYFNPTRSECREKLSSFICLPWMMWTLTFRSGLGSLKYNFFEVENIINCFYDTGLLLISKTPRKEFACSQTNLCFWLIDIQAFKHDVYVKYNFNVSISKVNVDYWDSILEKLDTPLDYTKYDI